ncbi:MAG: tetratricopeptide repeat protein [Cytophagales bacterium]|nr:tetratricopeptide repeat protein [Bernardetiaceae bacterium]MDW8210784.1 tetratricopeptide repeat protein [Cytophagales bacterium]
MKKLLLATVFSVGLFSIGFAQNCPCETGLENGWCWGKDPGTVKEKWTLFSDAINTKEYDIAIENGEWLLNNTPNLNVSLYIKAVQLYTALIGKTTEAAKREAYQDKVLALYDKRMYCFGVNKDVMERKGYVVYDYLITRKGREKEVYEFYKNLVAKYGEQLSSPVFFQYYMDAIGKAKEAGVSGITEETFMEAYDNEVVPILEKKIAAGGNAVESWQKAKDAIDGLVQVYVKVDCGFVNKNLGPKLKENPSDVKLAKKIVAYMTQCPSEPLFLEALQALFRAEPSAGNAITLGKLYLKQGRVSEAKEMYHKAIELLPADERSKKGDLVMELAKIAHRENKFTEARRLYKEAVSYDPANAKEAYKAIGDMYMASYQQCQGKNPVESRAVFLAAYDMYEKAGDSNGMAQAKAQFPSMEDIFTFGMQEGIPISVGCWINETTTLRKRPSMK